jgi:hypothetical protein
VNGDDETNLITLRVQRRPKGLVMKALTRARLATAHPMRRQRMRRRIIPHLITPGNGKAT